jgi:hypothetical protein
MDRIKNRRQNTSLKQKFGINRDQYEVMLNQQNGVCAICNEYEIVPNRSLSVDHDHNTGKVRGLLCSNCNPGIGKFKEKIELLEKAVEYLKRDYNVPSALETHKDIPRDERPNWKRIVFTSEGIFPSNSAAAKHYNVHEATMLAWCGHNKNKSHLHKEGFTSQKVYMSTKEIKENFNVKD